jgi:hypothetical protein
MESFTCTHCGGHVFFDAVQLKQTPKGYLYVFYRICNSEPLCQSSSIIKVTSDRDIAGSYANGKFPLPKIQ